MERGADHLYVAPVVVLVLELTSGLFLHVFILSIIVSDSYKQQTMSNSHKILGSLCISNVLFGILISAGLLDEFAGLRRSWTLDLSTLYSIFLLSSVGSCAWFTAGLGAFYFIKISQARRLSWIKFRLSSIVSWTSVVLVVVSVVSSSFSSFLISPVNRNLTDTCPSIMKMLAENTSGFTHAALVVTFTPFTLALLSTMCTITTLRRHSGKMKRSMETVDKKRLMSYMQVVSGMTHSLLFYGLIYALMLIFYFSITAHLETGFWMTLLLMSCFTPVQAILLILSNPRLRDAWKQMTIPQTCRRASSGADEG